MHKWKFKIMPIFILSDKRGQIYIFYRSKHDFFKNTEPFFQI